MAPKRLGRICNPGDLVQVFNVSAAFTIHKAPFNGTGYGHTCFAFHPALSTVQTHRLLQHIAFSWSHREEW